MINSIEIIINVDVIDRIDMIEDNCDNRSICNPSIGECECDKSCDFGEYLDYTNCKRRKTLIDKSVLQCNDKILNLILLNKTDAIALANKKVTSKNNCLVCTILLTIMCLTLKLLGGSI